MARKKIDLTIFKERCKGCDICVQVCPEHILEMSKEVNEKGMQFAVLFAPEKCTGCTICAVMCPDLAIEIKYSDKDGK